MFNNEEERIQYLIPRVRKNRLQTETATLRNWTNRFFLFQFLVAALTFVATYLDPEEESSSTSSLVFFNDFLYLFPLMLALMPMFLAIHADDNDYDNYFKAVLKKLYDEKREEFERVENDIERVNLGNAAEIEVRDRVDDYTRPVFYYLYHLSASQARGVKGAIGAAINAGMIEAGETLLRSKL